MRLYVYLLAALLSTGCALPGQSKSFKATMTYGYPSPDNLVTKGLVEQYKKNKSTFESTSLMSMPNPAPKWPCRVDEVEQYKLAGLEAAHPKLKPKGKNSASRKASTAFTNVLIIPLVAQCQAGKLEGELQILASYDTVSNSIVIVNNAFAPQYNGAKVTTVTKQHVDKRLYLNVKAGVKQDAGTTITDTSHVAESHSDNAELEAVYVKSMNNRPSLARSIILSGQGGISASFAERVIPSLATHSNTPNGPDAGKILTTTIIFPVDDRHKRIETYNNSALQSIVQTKDDKMHGEFVMYTSIIGLSNEVAIHHHPAHSPMQTAREVSIKGIDWIEIRSFYKNGIQSSSMPNAADDAREDELAAQLKAKEEKLEMQIASLSEKKNFEGLSALIDENPDAINYITDEELMLKLIGPKGMKVGDIQKMLKNGKGEAHVIQLIKRGQAPYKEFSLAETGTLAKMGLTKNTIASMIEVTLEISKEAKRKKEQEQLFVEQKKQEVAQMERQRDAVNPATASAGSTVGGAISDCAEKFAKKKLCEQLPWPASTACVSAIAKGGCF